MNIKAWLEGGRYTHVRIEREDVLELEKIADALLSISPVTMKRRPGIGATIRVLMFEHHLTQKEGRAPTTEEVKEAVGRLCPRGRPRKAPYVPEHHPPGMVPTGTKRKQIKRDLPFWKIH